MDERSAFLADIRTALGYDKAEARDMQQCPAVFADADDSLILDRVQYRTHVEKQALLQILQKNAEQLRLEVHPVSSLDGAAETIVEIIRAASPEFSTTRQIIQHDHADLIELGLWRRLAGEAVQVHTTYQNDPEVLEKSIESYIGLTVPRWAVAESATIVQMTGPGQPRSTSLLPSIHVALIRLEHLLADLSEVYALLGDEPPQDSFIFITGSSKTADIEAQLVLGAHGPRQMHLVVIDELLVENSTPLKGSGIFTSE